MELLKEDLARMAAQATDENLARTLATVSEGKLLRGAFTGDIFGLAGCRCPTALLLGDDRWDPATRSGEPFEFTPSRWDEATDGAKETFLVPTDHPAAKLLVEVVTREQKKRRLDSLVNEWFALARELLV